MSNIKIGYAANYLAHSASTTDVFAGLGDVYNFSRGARSVYTEESATGTSLNVTYDFGSDVTADHLFIARADLLQDNGVTGVTLSRSASTSGFVAEHTVSSFSSYDLKCPTNTDLLDTFSESSAYRYWRVSLTGSGSTYKHSKHCFGVGFDMGDDPVDVVAGVTHESYSLEHAAGDMTFLRLRRPQRTYKITWRGITDAKILDAVNTLFMWQDMPLYLYTTTDHEILGDHEVIQVVVSKKPKISKLANDYNEITVNFTETLG